MFTANMNFRFVDTELEALHKTGTGPASRRFPEAVTKSFMRLLAEIEAATDERDLRLLRSWRFEKLQRGDYSMRLNDQFRLIFDKASEEGSQILIIKGIEDYH